MFLSGPGEQLEWLPIANIMDFEKTIKICWIYFYLALI
jgi:hypothetical protein